MLAACGLTYVLVLGVLAWALWRSRGRRLAGDATANPEPSRGLTGWIGLMAAGLVLMTTVSFLVDRSLAEAGPDPLRIKVTARQWWWQVDYPGEIPSEAFTAANELHLPVNRPAVIELRARDAIHAFWVPALSAKADLIPGRTNYLAVTPRRVGTFRGQCGEVCGLQHARMTFDVHVEDPASFEAWRRRQIASTSAPPSFGAALK
jgi:cytochrome c oxidase subunit II